MKPDPPVTIHLIISLPYDKSVSMWMISCPVLFEMVELIVEVLDLESSLDDGCEPPLFRLSNDMSNVHLVLANTIALAVTERNCYEEMLTATSKRRKSLRK
jgi:hypothetical protein